MSISTANAVPVSFVDFARNMGITDLVAIGKLQAQFNHIHKTQSTTPIAVAEPTRFRDDYFGPEIVATPAKAKTAKVKAPSIYRELQATCKEYGLKANGNTAALQTRIAMHIKGTATSDMYAKVKPAPREKKAAKKNLHLGLNYRQSQRLVKWFKENMPSTLLPAMLNKNIGWSNVSANVDMLLVSHGWAANLQDRHFSQLAEYIGLDSDALDTFLLESGLV